MAKSYNEMLALASTIRTATEEGENTAERVGEFMAECMDFIHTADNSLSSSLSSEITRAQDAEATLQTSLTSETNRATAAEQTIATNVSGLTASVTEHTSTLEQVLAKNAEQDNDIEDLEDDLTAEQTRAVNAENTIASNVSGLTTTVNEHTSTLEQVLAKNAEQDTAISDNATAAAAAQSTADSAYELANSDAALRPLYALGNSVGGATYNSSTGYYELNGLTNITKAQMLAIYNFTRVQPGPSSCSPYGIRTNFPWHVYSLQYTTSSEGTLDLSRMFRDCALIEVCVLTTGNYYASPDNVNHMFKGCSKLTSVSKISFERISDSTKLLNMFKQCTLLESVSLMRLKISGLSFADSPNLSAESISYLIENATNTEAISVTVHSDVLAAINLGEGDWAGIADAATTQQISFVTA